VKDNIVKLDELKQEFKAKVERFHALESVVNELEHTVDDADIAAVIARRTGIPVTK